ncbi:tripartite tricarboxylate transporter substrate binding protein [Variovorax sp.]|uniref:Bug family tripartite tricarboxylate transporter substrate binding protein n=1 Tax=Variovorax sp. TaxID=1871043 RepID=UPI002D65BE11|nr:tripartite tricarboxylate transporter substrate binding protein [Variovorax sp.]HYP84454.1 tripartite tricarboxylate transporter substrate binding protein [Variovorax sp.]
MNAYSRQNIDRRTVLEAFAAAGLAMTALRAAAQGDYPNRPLRIVVPFTPGSGSDSASRFFGEKLSGLVDQGVIVENRPGANGLITIKSVKDAPADGYSILLGNISLMAVNPVVLKDVGYDPLTDFKPLSGLYRATSVFAVPNESPYETLEELLEAARHKPLSMGTYSQGYRLATEYLANLSGAKFTNIPYKGQGRMMADLLGNQLDCALLDLSGAATTIRLGKLRALAMSGAQRNSALPDVPTVAEQGYPEYSHYSWVGFFVRAETPADIAGQLTDLLQRILETPDAAQFVMQMSGDLMPYPPARMQRFVGGEIKRFRKVAQAAGISPQ